ncbi:MAG: tRNA (adenosine(37)-N6)-threonylcarbamoyltransferase complex dimerization subunit type 1 TsaB [Castellaniella sp.]|uniref:tRNA (adenosine(37)-N6)-threonylcarbamoyltransferase complex dimerization subunit type 1 TsaB n=1 Tax=Castellaniella sp. TaxID=1955812 RepID=UPI002A3599B7|nr:tRNA (adenosine(37)-N6)-threonylcarbamoyltransferase complex dimerization subunit type 1 TsaB [Castellaniella sp.]MDY0310351.1 tRNA (adenosine(37)-N6)-threonylcarbamoyltransferase complex dimerization subunit type 1 TsaB [Castellaniella sp.]
MISCATSASPILVLCCAEERVQVVLGTSSELLFAEEMLCPGQSIRHLPMAMDRALKSRGLGAKNLAGIACVRGPGSFTGLRIAHAAMYGLARPAGLPMAGLEYHAVLARQIPTPARHEVWIATHARKGQVYLRGFIQEQPLDDIKPMAVTEAARLLVSRQAPRLVAGSGARRNPELGELAECPLLPVNFDTPAPMTLLQAALDATFSEHAPTPLYLRKSDAEDNLEAIALSRGIPVADARRHIFDFE